MRINPNTAKIRDNKKIRHLFYIIPHFSYEIKIFIVSLQNEEEDKKEKRGGPENKKVVQKTRRWSRNEKCHFATYRQQWEYHFPRDC